MPIRRGENDFLGVIAVRIKATAIDNILTGETARRLGRRRFLGISAMMGIYIVDAGKNVIASGDKELLGKKADTEIVRKTLSARKETMAEFAGIHGDTRIGASMYLQEPGWVVIASASKKHMLAPLDNLFYTAFLLILSGVILVISITVFLTKRITGSLSEVSRAATRIAFGHFEERVSVKGKKDEIADVGNAFNEMAINLQGTIDSLTEREERLSIRNRFYSVLMRINEAIVRFREPEKLFEEACRICVDEGLFKFVWVGLADKETSLIRPVARYGMEDGVFG